MKVDCVEQLQVWQRALRLSTAVSARTRTGTLARDLRLREQMDACVDSMLANLAEGFAQGSDRGFARYLYIAKGSCAELKAHLAIAQVRGLLSPEATESLRQDAEQVARMLAGLIKYLLRCNRKHRG